MENNMRSLAQQHVGRPVIVHSSYGTHRGVLHHLDDNGLYLQLQKGNGAGHANAEQKAVVENLSRAGSANLDAEHVFWPFFFIPFAAALAISPWFWGPYWW